MRILLTGATGFIGSHLHGALVAAGHRVVTCSRTAPTLPNTEHLHCDFTEDHRPEEWLPRLVDVEVVINAVGIIRERGGQTFRALHTDAPRALFAACERAGVRKVVQISALGADGDAVSVYHLTKRAADEALARRALEWLILRPSIVYGAGARSSAFFRALAALPITPVVGDGRQPVQPIHIDDLVRAVLLAVEPDGPSGRSIDVVGPRPVAFAELLEGWRRWLGFGPMRSFGIPYRLALTAGRFGGFLGDAPLDREAIIMLQQGNRADVEPFMNAFGFRPRALEEVLTSTPATDADRWHAGLYFLPPLLRWSLGLMWLWAGVTSAFLYPVSASYGLLAQLGITGILAPITLYGAALLDGVLGAALLAGYRVRAVGAVQLVVIVAYTVLITWALPAFWLHPFGPVVKNLPLLISTLVMMALEARGK